MKYCDSCKEEMRDVDSVEVNSSDEYSFHNIKGKDLYNTYVCYDCSNKWISFVAKRNNGLRKEIKSKDNR